MNDELVMRSVYLRLSEDGGLRQLAFENHVTKSDLIRSAIGAKLAEWLADPTNAVLLKDLELGRRTPPGDRGDTAPVAAPATVATVAAKPPRVKSARPGEAPVQASTRRSVPLEAPQPAKARQPKVEARKSTDRTARAATPASAPAKTPQRQPALVD
jgi:hypothetical protein